MPWPDNSNIFSALTAGLHFKKPASKAAGSASTGLHAPANGRKRRHEELSENSDGDQDVNATQQVAANQTAQQALSASQMTAAALSNDPAEGVNLMRKQYGIRVTGGSAPAPLGTFAELGSSYSCSQRLMANLEENGWQEPTAIQRQAISALLEHKELFAVAPTGSGKTLAFLLPLVAHLHQQRCHRQVTQPEQAADHHTNSRLGAGKKQKRQSGTQAVAPKSPELADAPSDSNLKKKRRASAIGAVQPVPGAVAGNFQASKEGKKKSKGSIASGDTLPQAAVHDADSDATGSGAVRNGPGAAANGSSARAKSSSTGLSGPGAVVLAPSRELAAQTARCLVRLVKGLRLHCCLLTAAVAAGADFSKVDLIVATPKRLAHLVKSKQLNLASVEFLILDEADKLFEAGFLRHIDTIIHACSHPSIVRGLFSATLPEGVEALASNVLQAPIRLTVGSRNAAASAVAQRLLFVGQEQGKLLGLKQLIAQGLKPPVLLFVSSRERAEAVYKQVMYDGVHADIIHSSQPQAQRNAAVDKFRAGATWLLIATDLVGRGMDFLGVQTVINYDFPQSTTDYIHRVGRTGRAGRSGEAVTFYTEDDAWQLRSIVNVMRAAGCDVPEWMLQLKKERRQSHTKVTAKATKTSKSKEAKTAGRAINLLL